jgi:hypothetical protein
LQHRFESNTDQFIKIGVRKNPELEQPAVELHWPARPSMGGAGKRRILTLLTQPKVSCRNMVALRESLVKCSAMSWWGFCLGRRTITKCTLARYCSVKSTCLSELSHGSGKPLWDVGPDSFPRHIYGLNCFSEIATSRSCTGDTLRDQRIGSVLTVQKQERKGAGRFSHENGGPPTFQVSDDDNHVTRQFLSASQ